MGPASASRASSVLRQPRAQLGARLSKYDQAKFVLATSAPALIQPEEADRLIDYVVDESVLFQLATVERMDTNEKHYRFADVSGGILRAATCGTDAADSVDIVNTNKCLRVASLDASMYLCDDDLEDGITGAQLETQVLRMAGDQIANELELLAIMSNTNGIYTNPLVNNAVMAMQEGWYRQLQHGHNLDAGNVPGEVGNAQLTYHKLSCLLRALPTKYRRNPAALRIFMNSDVLYDWAELNQPRDTPFGDSSVLGPLEQRYLSTPLVGVPLLPNDLTVCGCGSVAGGGGTFAFVTEPSNLVLGIERNISFERERFARQHRTFYIWTIRVGFLVLNEDATALLDCLTLSECGDACVPDALETNCTCLEIGSGGQPLGQ
jgi:hypothetical protein